MQYIKASFQKHEPQSGKCYRVYRMEFHQLQHQKKKKKKEGYLQVILVFFHFLPLVSTSHHPRLYEKHHREKSDKKQQKNFSFQLYSYRSLLSGTLFCISFGIFCNLRPQIRHFLSAAYLITYKPLQHTKKISMFFFFNPI